MRVTGAAGGAGPVHLDAGVPRTAPTPYYSTQHAFAATHTHGRTCVDGTHSPAGDDGRGDGSIPVPSVRKRGRPEWNCYPDGRN